MLATNPYSGLEEPYTGALNASDFIEDFMVLQMEISAYKYETDIIVRVSARNPEASLKLANMYVSSCAAANRFRIGVVQSCSITRPPSHNEQPLRHRSGSRLRQS